MSRQPSPGPVIPGQQPSYYRDAHGLPIEKGHLKITYRAGEQADQSQRGAPAPGTVATSSSSSGRTKSRAYQSGIAAGAEDVKYAAKYRDLKAKVKDIESDNDRLLFKVLQAKRNIQRAKLERAILYERLGALPASPPPGNAPLPPQHVAQQAPPGTHVPRHADAPAYREAGRRQRTSGSSVPHHHHSQHHQQPIQPAPPPHVSPPEHHMQAHHPHHPSHDMAHPGQLPITHAQQVCTIQTAEGPLVVVAGPDGRPVTTADGLVIPAQDIHAPPPPSAPSHRKRGGRVSKEVRETREKEAREMREREEMERKREQALREGTSGQAPGGPPPEPTRSSSSSRSHSAHMQGVSPQLASQVPVAPASSREQRERQRDWDVEREVRDRERAQRREAREDASVHGGHHHHHNHHHGHRYQERIGGSPPPSGGTSGLSPIRTSPPPPLHRSHSQSSHYSGHSHGHGHGHVHSHSHSHSPHSPGGGPYPHTRIHGHQRVGPGSYVIRDRERADAAAAAAAAEQANAATPAAPTPVPANEGSVPVPAAASNSRVPTPPYIQRPARTESFNNNHASPPTTGEDVAPPNSGAKTDVRPAAEDGTIARSSSTTPS